MNHDRRSVLAAFGLALPFGLPSRSAAAPTGAAPSLRLRSFEEAVTEAFRVAPPGSAPPRFRIEIGYSDAVLAGVQGCHNDRPFAGYAAGRLRIVRTGSGPGPIIQGVRLYVATVDVELADGVAGVASRPLDFSKLPAAPVLLSSAGTN